MGFREKRSAIRCNSSRKLKTVLCYPISGLVKQIFNKDLERFNNKKNPHFFVCCSTHMHRIISLFLQQEMIEKQRKPWAAIGAMGIVPGRGRERAGLRGQMPHGRIKLSAQCGGISAPATQSPPLNRLPRILLAPLLLPADTWVKFGRKRKKRPSPPTTTKKPTSPS